MKPLIPPELIGKGDVLFGNLEEIYAFHNDIFLKDLQNCISTTELVALCFTHRVRHTYCTQTLLLLLLLLYLLFLNYRKMNFINYIVVIVKTVLNLNNSEN